MRSANRYDRTLRTVMWTDGFLSVAFVLVWVVATPVMATLGVPRAMLAALGLASAVCAAVLAACGAVTAVLLALRLRAGNYLLPHRLRVPLPPGMSPFRRPR